MARVAIIIPTMNRPDFILRQFKFYELMESSHLIYISDSSNEENAQRIRDGVKQFKKLNITYQWVPPGKDHLYSLLPSIKEKYCIQMGDDDLIIPKTISKCADFLEDHPDYATCGGKQVNIRFRSEDYDKPWGIIDRQTKPLGRSLEHENMFARVKDFWSDPPFICFTVRRTETERKIRNITKHLFLLDYVTEFVLWSALIIYGKAKVLDELGYVMQISDNRHPFVDYPGIDHFIASPSSVVEKWEILINEISEILQEFGKTKEQSLKIAKWMFTLYLIHQFILSVNDPGSLSPVDQKQSSLSKQKLLKKIKYFILDLPFVKKIYYKFNSPNDVTRSESKYFKDFRIVKDFLEKNNR